MYVVERKELKDLIRQILMGREIRDLTLRITNSDVAIQNKSISSVPFERRRMTDETQAVVSFPTNRILNPASRSPHDIWTIIYKNKLVAKAKFQDLKKVLNEIPRQIVSFPSLVSKQIVVGLGIVGIMGLCFFMGFYTSRKAESVKAKAMALNYEAEINKLNALLGDVLVRQDTMKSMIATIPLEKAKSANQERVNKTAVSLNPDEKFTQQMEDMELKHLIELEKKRDLLLLQDLEMDNQGLASNHWNRRPLRASIEALNKEISRIKQKYGIVPE